MQTNIKVLVLEDSSCFIATLNKDLNRFGYVLDFVNDIKDALSLALVNIYKIIIVDVAKVDSSDSFLFYRYQINSQK
jgi:ActR/RegA family two-component response regulator